MSESIPLSTRSRSTIVEQILEQGQRLRNAMVKSILDNDPFYIDVVDTNNLKNAHTKRSIQRTAEKDLSSNRKQKLIAGFEWDDASPFESPPTMSADDFYCTCKICSLYRNQATWDPKLAHSNAKGQLPPLNILQKGKVRQLSGAALGEYDSEDSQIPRDAPRMHASRNLPDIQWFHPDAKLPYSKPDQQSPDIPVQPENLSEEITRSIQDEYRFKAAEYFKYVNSLKITIHSLALNQDGNRKATASAIDSKFKLPTSVSHSYFVEYSVPESLVNSQPKTKSKIDTGLSSSVFRICSKKLHNEEIYFKHSSVHDIVSLLQLNLDDIDIKFQVSCRTPKQKQTNVLGNATFKMSMFELTKHLSCSQDFTVTSEDFVMGTLKMTLQLGCGRMYFGKEFVEFVLKNTKGPESSTSEKSDNRITVVYTSPPPIQPPTIPSNNKGFNQAAVSLHSNSVDMPSEKPSPGFPVRQRNGQAGHFSRYAKQMSPDNKLTSEEFVSSASTNRSSFQNTVKENTNFPERLQRTANTEVNNLTNKSLLYGLIYVSEAQYFEGPINSYFSCQVFGQGDTLSSRVVYQSKDPVFNFYQKVPFLLDDTFLLCMRDNFIVVDFWERKGNDDIAVGASQLSLHQFYVAYRNRVIANTLLQNRLPVTISDWWEPICSPVNGNLFGQMKVLVAVGTADQIHNLEVERGLKDDSSSVTYIPIVPEAGILKKPSSKAAGVRSFKRPDFLKKTVKEPAPSTAVSKENKKVLNNSPPNKDVVKVSKIDIGVQSDLDMEQNSEQQSDNKTQDLLEAFLTELIKQKQKNIYVENATNTDVVDVHNNLNKNINTEREGSSVTDSLNKLSTYKNATNMQLRKTSDLLEYLNGALAVDEKSCNSEVASLTIPKDDENHFKAHVIVEGALHLPSRRKCRLKKTRRKNVLPEESLPSTYVTFETIPGVDLKISDVVPRSTNPQWDFKCDVMLPGEILTNSQKRFIFKVWRKNNGNSPHPNLQTDIILGFAALDLTVLLAGLPSLQGWFNIVDFSSKCNGQIKIQVTPLENISRFSETKISPSPETVRPDHRLPRRQLATANLIDTQEPPGELLSRALKRKFTELEEITQRLRSRLADVTKDDSDNSTDEFADEFERDLNTLCVEDDYNMIDLTGLPHQPSYDLLKIQDDEWLAQPFSHLENGANNYLLKEATCEGASNFGPLTEPSIYSRGVLPSESAPKAAMSDSAYGSTRMSDRTGKSFRPLVTNSVSSSSSNTFLDTASQTIPNRALTPGDKQLIAGKQRIDTLLEKLTLLAGNDAETLFPSRYVSGCSMNQEGELATGGSNSKDKELSSSSGINLDTILNPALFSQLCSVNMNSTPSLTEFSEGLDSSSSNAQFGNGSSSNSLLTQFSTYRQAPDGAGTSADLNSNANIANKQDV